MSIVLLSFDVEEFDLPLEYSKPIPFDLQMEISAAGTDIVLDILERHQIVATFFSTAVFATHAPAQINRIVAGGHELASHSYFHSKFSTEDLTLSKETLEKYSKVPITGFRMPRMKTVPEGDIYAAGYTYNSSLNPTFLPGRYNNFLKPKRIYQQGGIIQVPASVTPLIRFPLFWLSFHNMPLPMYKLVCQWSMNSDSYLNLYFHPWEFADFPAKVSGLPKYITRNSGKQMSARFNSLIAWMKNKGYEFSTIQNFLKKRDGRLDSDKSQN